MRLTPLTWRVPLSARRVMLNRPGAEGDPRQLEKALHRDAELAYEALEMLRDELEPEGVVTGGHRRVGREHAGRRHRFQRGIERQAVAEVLAQQLEDQERGVAFVQVPYGRLHAQGAQRAHAADAENHLLAHARGVIAAVEPMGDVAIGRGVVRAVGVEQVHRHAPHLRAPHARAHVATRRCARAPSPIRPPRCAPVRPAGRADRARGTRRAAARRCRPSA